MKCVCALHRLRIWASRDLRACDGWNTPIGNVSMGWRKFRAEIIERYGDADFKAALSFA